MTVQNLSRKRWAHLMKPLILEILITILVIIVMVFNLRASVLISGLLPVAVLMVFIAMKFFGVPANIVALSGIAIAIGTMVDVGVILSENIIRHLDEHEQTGREKPTHKYSSLQCYFGSFRSYSDRGAYHYYQFYSCVYYDWGRRKIV